MTAAPESYSESVDHLSDSRSAQRKAKAAKVEYISYEMMQRRVNPNH